MKRVISPILVLLLIALCAGCGAPVPADGTTPAAEPQETADERDTEGSEPEIVRNNETEAANAEKGLHLSINDREVTVDWEDNESAAALKDLVSSGPLTVQMSMYGGFEQVGPIGTRLPSSDVQTTAAAGDIVLYSGNQIVIFYGSNSWAYTRLGHIADQDAAGMAALLGNGDVTITISMEGAE